MPKVSTGFIEVLSPIARHRVKDVKLATRPGDLNGKVLGLLDNGKPNAQTLISDVADVLAKKYQLAAVVRQSKADGGPGAGGPCPDPMRAELVNRCDAILNAAGD